MKGEGLGAAGEEVRLGPPPAAPSPSRSCAVCGKSLEGRRRHARHCDSTCRAEAHRRRRQPIEWTFWSGAWDADEKALSALSERSEEV